MKPTNLIAQLSWRLPASSMSLCSKSLVILILIFVATARGQQTKEQKNLKESATKPTIEQAFRPIAGQFPPLEKSHSYRGELVFVDHANRRGSVRVQGSGMFFRNDPHPFAMLPYGIIRYHGAPADLRDIPLGTMLHVRAFLPPDPKTSSVPVLPENNKSKDANHNRGAGIAPAENHVILLEDEPSYCQREGLVWTLKELDIHNYSGHIVASRQPSKTATEASVADEKLTFDAATRIWRGRELLGIADLVAEGAWPGDGKKTFNNQSVLLGISWKPTPDGIFTRFHISDIWLDEDAMLRAAKKTNGGSQSVHSQSLDAGHGRLSRLRTVWSSHCDSNVVWWDGCFALPRFQAGGYRHDERCRKHAEAHTWCLRTCSYGITRKDS